MIDRPVLLGARGPEMILTTKTFAGDQTPAGPRTPPAGVGQAWVPVAHELVVDSLHLPAGSTITAVQLSPTGEVMFHVEHRDLPAVKAGHRIPTTPVWVRREAGPDGEEIVRSGFGADKP